MPVELVSIPEIATMLGVSRQRVHQLIQQYDDFPRPLAELAIGRVWDRLTVAEWDATHPRLTGRPRNRFCGGTRDKLFDRKIGFRRIFAMEESGGDPDFIGNLQFGTESNCHLNLP